MTVDICFALDVTGSMSAWLEACKAQISAIVTGLAPKIQQKAGDALPVSMRWSLVAYRDACDGAGQLHTVDFCSEGAELVKEVRRSAPGDGGPAACGCSPEPSPKP